MLGVQAFQEEAWSECLLYIEDFIFQLQSFALSSMK